MGATDWSPMETMSCEDASDYLESKIIEAMDIVAPIETKKSGTNQKTNGSHWVLRQALRMQLNYIVNTGAAKK